MVPQPMGPAHTRRDPADPIGTPNAASEEAELVIMGPKETRSWRPEPFPLLITRSRGSRRGSIDGSKAPISAGGRKKIRAPVAPLWESKRARERADEAVTVLKGTRPTVAALSFRPVCGISRRGGGSVVGTDRAPSLR
jgi:hypothetical protein